MFPTSREMKGKHCGYGGVLEKLEQKVESLKTLHLTEQQELALSAFRKALKRREEGKPDDGFMYDDDDID
jgi:hypothetical protein